MNDTQKTAIKAFGWSLLGLTIYLLEILFTIVSAALIWKWHGEPAVGLSLPPGFWAAVVFIVTILRGVNVNLEESDLEEVKACAKANFHHMIWLGGMLWFAFYLAL